MSDDTNLTLPGSIPGLLRRGSPVIHVDGRHGVAVEIVPEYDGNQLVAWLMPYDQDLDCCPDVADIALDLSDATGRAHAAWWLAAKCAPEAVPVGTRMRCIHRDGSTMAYLDWHWFIDNMGGTTIWIGATHPHQQCVPGLADLDPLDPRLLPDGSRWVDAEALRRVCLHVAGLPLT